MKQHPIKNSSLRGVLFILLCIVGIGNVWGEKYKHITSTSELVVGCRYIIASMMDGSGAVMKNYVSGDNNWKQVETDAINSYITYKSGMARLTLGNGPATSYSRTCVLPSALRSLTSVFGMGTGVPSLPSSLDRLEI